MEDNSTLSHEQLSLSILPNELIVFILSYITRTIDKQSTSLVSKKWWASSWNMTTKLDIYFGQAVLNKMELADFQRVLQHCNNVTALYFTRTTFYSVPISWPKSFFSLPKIAHLTWTAWNNTPWFTHIENLKSLSAGELPQGRHKELEQLSNLTHLDLSINVDESSAILIGKLTNLLSLSILDLLTPDHIFATLTNLTKLQIRSPNFSIILANITKLNDLKCLVIDTPIHLARIDNIIKLTSLESIKIRKKKERALLKLLQLSALTKLSFAGAQISGDSWSLLTHMTNLKHLDLKGASVSVSVNGSRSLEFLQQLRKLEIPFNQNINVMLETIIDAEIKLKSLVIHGCQQMTRSTLKLIVQLTSLRKLELADLNALDTYDIYEVTVLSNLRVLSLSTPFLSSDQLLVRPFLALTKLRKLYLGCRVIKEEAELMQPSTMIFLEKLNCKIVYERPVNRK